MKRKILYRCLIVGLGICIMCGIFLFGEMIERPWCIHNYQWTLYISEYNQYLDNSYSIYRKIKFGSNHSIFDENNIKIGRYELYQEYVNIYIGKKGMQGSLKLVYGSMILFGCGQKNEFPYYLQFILTANEQIHDRY